MCGICGKLVFDRATKVDERLLASMTDAIAHRGPDDDGFYFDGQVGLGHRRLSIIDLATGHQPLANEDESVWVIFNGEIYNYKELRQQLLSAGHRLKTESDSETLVHLYEQHGPEFVRKLRGMFAFALWDKKKRLLMLARDRVGIKPMYYRMDDRSILFGSEIKAILADPSVRAEVVPQGIDQFLTFLYMPGDQTLLKGIRKLPPGHYMTVQDGRADIREYWDLSFAKTPRPISETAAEERLIQLLDESVQGHMISDVPVGFLLSGGVDSTAMLSFAMGKTDKPLSSFTIGFSEKEVADERPYARLAAQHFGSQHYEMTISAENFRDFLPNYVWHMEEPVCEPPAVALYYISKLAREHVKVLISGEGGDEALAGYSNYRNLLWFERAKSLLGPLKGVASQAMALASRLMNSERMAKYVPLVSTPFDRYYYSRTSGPFSYFNQHFTKLYTPGFAGRVNKAASLEVMRCLLARANSDLLDKMLYLDTKTWLPDDLLVKADKMTMANSVELRVPFLDHTVLEFAASLPGNLKVRGLTTKYLAKKALRKRVPQAILDRPKAGFPVPYERWLRKELRPWIEDVLFDRKTAERGYFERSEVRALFDDYVNTGRHPKEIFSLVVLELWHRIFMDGEKVSPPKPRSEPAAEAIPVAGD